MAWSLITNSADAFGVAGSGTTVPVDLGAAVAAGDFIIVGVQIRSGDGVALTNVTDSLGNSYEQAAAPYDEATNTGRIFYRWICKNVTNAGTPTITANFDGAAFSRNIHVSGWTGGHNTAPLDDDATGTAATGTAMNTATMSPAEDDELLWCFGEHGAEIPAGANGFTTLATDGVIGQNASAYKIQTAATPEAGSLSTGSGGVWAIVGLSLKAAPTGPETDSDDFTTNDIANWTSSTAFRMSISGGVFRANASGDPALERRNTITPGESQYSQCIIKTFDTVADLGIGPAIRIATGADTCYWFFHNTVDEYRLVRMSAGSIAASLGAYTAGVPAVDDEMLLIGVGSNLRCLINGVERITVSDATLASGGVGVRSIISSVIAEIDLWEGGDYVEPPITDGPALTFVRSSLRW